MRKIRDEQKGSAVVLVVFILAILMGGFFYTQMEKVVDEIENIVENDESRIFVNTLGAPLVDDPVYNLYIDFFGFYLPTIMLIGLSLFFIRSLRKDRYEQL